MNNLHKFAFLCAAGAMSACSSSEPETGITPVVSGVSQNSAGTYSITVDGTNTAFAGAPMASGNGFEVWNGGGSQTHIGYVYESGSVLAMGVMDVATDATIAGISGTAASNVPIAGFASYAGGFSLTYYRNGAENDSWNARGSFNTDVDFTASTVTGSGTGNYASSLSIAGILDGTQFNGVAQFSALEYTGPATALMTGGLYGTDTVAGVYQGSSATGVFYGIEAP